jgi:hypothetical protein
VQRGLLSRRAEQLTAERQKLKERIAKLTVRLLPYLAPQLKKFPQVLQLQPESEPIANCEDGLTTGYCKRKTLQNACVARFLKVKFSRCEKALQAEA